MDKKYAFLGILCIVIALGLGYQSMRDDQKIAQYQQDHPELYATTGAAGNTTAGNSTATTTGNTTPAPATAATSGNAIAAAPAAPAPEVPTTPPALAHLESDDVNVTFTEDGGAIQTIELKKYVSKLHGADHVMFNAGAPRPALALSVPTPIKPGYTTSTYWSWTGTSATSVIGNAGVPPVPLLARFTLDKAATNATSVTFRGTTADGLELVRTYTLGSGSDDAYLIHHTTTIVNRGAKPISLERLFVNAGMAPAPAPEVSNSLAQTYLNFGYYDGKAASFVTVSQFMDQPARLLGLFPAHAKEKDNVYGTRDSADLQWVSVKDFFFTTVLMPQGITGKGFYVQGVPATVDGTAQTTVTGDLELGLGILAPGQQKKLELTFYAGPKDYVRLDHLGQHEDLNMQFGWFSDFSKILLLALIAIHKFIAPLSPTWAWGWTIIVFSIIVKGVTWPLTAIQVRSSRRMAKLQAPMKALKEKYKDNPQKLQAETIELYREHKINPAAGCLPLLITFPIFIAFNSVLRTAAEMRFAGFFWMHDLAAPDTIAHLAGFSINLLPLLMSATTMLQMRMVPAPSMDPSQKMMMQIMPLMMLGFFYTMPSGMILYWTCNNLFTILQQWLNKHQVDIDPADKPAATVAAPDRPTVKRR